VDAHCPGLELTSVTVCSPDPRGSADFYARLLGAEVTASEPARPGKPEQYGWAQVRTPRVTLNFEFEQCWRPPVWPARPGEQIATAHLDIRVDDLHAARDWATRCGAHEAAEQPQDDVRVMIDPQGHPFCLFG
jgi:catechol 2,3-dioxygenase-like lactoylglutathione lyase family enzyme